MNEEPVNYHPEVLLDDWLRHTGHAGNKRGTGSTVSYVKLDTLADNGEWVEKWFPLYVGDDALAAIETAYLGLIQRWHDEWEQGRTVTSSKLISLVVMTYGEGAIRRRESDTPEEELDQELLDLSSREPVPARIIQLISIAGTAAEATMFFHDREPMSERFIVTADDDGLTLSGSLPHVSEDDQLTQAMMIAFTVLTMLGATLEDGNEPSVGGLIRKAKEYRGDEGGDILWKMLSNFVDTVDGAASRAADLAELRDELRGIIDE